MNGTPILLCSNFTFISPAGGGEITFPWVGFDASFEKADLVIECKLVSSGNVDVKIDTSTDTTMPSGLGSTNIGATGSTTTPITSGLLQMVRLVISSSGAAGVTLSITLVPKHS